jgi:predicted ATP-grasp superfamily ATP-dependent carboligase
MERILHHHHTNLNSNDNSMQVFVDGQHVSMKFLCSGKKKKTVVIFGQLHCRKQGLPL